MNGGGSLGTRAEKFGAEAMLSQIVPMVAQAQRSKAPLLPQASDSVISRALRS